MTKAHTPPLVDYAAAAAQYGVSISALQRRVGAGRLTRHVDPRDERRTLLDLGELERMFNTARLAAAE